MGLVGLSLFVLLAASPAAPEGERPTSDYDATLQRIQDASLAVSGGIERERLDELACALDLIEGFGVQLSADERGRELVLGARLNLLRGYQRLNPRRAERLAEDIVRDTVGILITPRYGPEVSEMVSTTQSRMISEGTATIEVRCQTQCRIAVDTYPKTETSVDVYLGPHTIWINSLDRSVPPTQIKVDLDVAGEVTTIEFGALEAPASSIADAPTLDLSLPDTPLPQAAPSAWDAEFGPIVSSPEPATPVDVVERERLLPRTVEIGGLAIGAGLGAAGAGLWGHAAGCDVQQCPQALQSTVSGATLVGIGGVLLVTSAVLLSVDERRARTKSKRRVRLGPGPGLRF